MFWRSFQIILALYILRTKFRIRMRNMIPSALTACPGAGLYELKIVLAGCSNKLSAMGYYERLIYIYIHADTY